MSKTKKEIWNTLFSIDVSPLVKWRDNQVYLPWVQMHVLMMEHFPEYSWSFSEDQQMREAHYYEGGSCEVRCTMTIGEHTIITSLPVGEPSHPLLHPHARVIADAKQRCRVKAAAEFGLGFALWYDADSFQPASDSPAPAPAAKKKEDDHVVVREYFDKHVRSKATRPEAVAGKKKLLSGLKSRKLPIDNVEGMWTQFCKEQEWSA